MENKICVRARCVAWGRNKNFATLNLNYFAFTLSHLVHVLKLCVFTQRNRVVLQHKSVFTANKEAPILDPLFCGNKDEALSEIEKMEQID